jgi:hypothetical protein
MAQFRENPSRFAVNGLGVESVRTRAGFFSVRVLGSVGFRRVHRLKLPPVSERIPTDLRIR